jgi:hypothetical protein
LDDFNTDDSPKRRESDRDGNRNERWHIGKEIPLAVLLMLFVQTSGGIWWAANVTAKIDYAIANMEEFKRERYTREDARRDFEAMKARHEELVRRVLIIEQGYGMRSR